MASRKERGVKCGSHKALMLDAKSATCTSSSAISDISPLFSNCLKEETCLSREENNSFSFFKVSP
ncbi:MAG: hypothetical protein IIZ79_00950, partial [Aeriscardovia sp.]|nr:hypothetical protein [Aeriscardovia sp.]